MLTRELIAKVRRIEIRTRRIVDDLTGGAYQSVFKGKGIEFDEVREYLPGDDVRTIDWNVTARTGKPFVKEFVEERELTVFLLVDISASGDFGSVEREKNELAAELAALLAFSAIRNNDQVGLLLFTSRAELHLRPRKGTRHVLRLVRDMLVHQRTDPRTDIRNALETLMKVVHRRAVVFLISDFLDDGYRPALTIANKRHDVVAIRIGDPREEEIPPAGLMNLHDAETGQQMLLPPFQRRYRAHFLKARAEEYARTVQTCRRAGVDLIDVVNGEDYIRPLMRFFRTRESRR